MRLRELGICEIAHSCKYKFMHRSNTFGWVECACGVFSGYKFVDLSYHLYISKVIPINMNAFSVFLKMA